MSAAQLVAELRTRRWPKKWVGAERMRLGDSSEGHKCDSNVGAVPRVPASSVFRVPESADLETLPVALIWSAAGGNTCLFQPSIADNGRGHLARRVREASKQGDGLDMLMFERGSPSLPELRLALHAARGLRVLCFRGTPLGRSGGIALAQSLTESCPHLEALLVERGEFPDGNGAGPLAIAFCALTPDLRPEVRPASGRAHPLRPTHALGARGLDRAPGAPGGSGPARAAPRSQLHLRRNALREGAGRWIAACLTRGSPLETLDLAHNLLGQDGARALAEALCKPCTGGAGAGGEPEGAVAPEEARGRIQRREAVAIAPCAVHALPARACVAAARRPALAGGLRSLHLGHNAVGCAGATFLAHALTANASLTALHLPGNRIQPDGAEALATALELNASLAQLDLAANQVRARGATALAGALRANRALALLDISRNLIPLEGRAATRRRAGAADEDSGEDGGGSSGDDDGGPPGETERLFLGALAAAPAAYPPVVSSSTVAFARELGASRQVLNVALQGDARRRFLATLADAALEPIRRKVVLGLRAPRLVSAATGTNLVAVLT